MVNYAIEEGKLKSEILLHHILKIIPALQPSKNAVDYWLIINKSILDYAPVLIDLWQMEKEAAIESIEIAKEEGLRYLATERERIVKLSRNEALQELIKISKIDSKIRTIESMTDTGLFGIGTE